MSTLIHDYQGEGRKGRTTTWGVVSQHQVQGIMQDDPKKGLSVTPGEGMHF